MVGAGSAGCVIASRLSETGARVTLLEAGPTRLASVDPHSRRCAEAAASSGGQLELQRRGRPGTAGRAIHWPRGKVLGGSSSINGMLYVRGNPADFDGWAQMGCRGWSFDDVLPYLPQVGTLRAGRRCGVPRQGRPAARRGLPHHPAADAPLRRSRAAGRLHVQHGPERQDAGGRRLFADDAQGPVPRLYRADFPGGGEEARRTCASKPTRWRRACCSTASAASAWRSASAAWIARRAPHAR